MATPSMPTHRYMTQRTTVMKPRSLTRWLSHLMGAAALLITGAAAAADVNVMISAGFYQAYSELAPAFERSSGHRLVTTRGPSLGDSSESIPNRLKRGEPADVVIGIGTSIDDLSRQGLLRAGSKVDLARSEIGMVVRAGAREAEHQQRRRDSGRAAAGHLLLGGARQCGQAAGGCDGADPLPCVAPGRAGDLEGGARAPLRTVVRIWSSESLNAISQLVSRMCHLGGQPCF